MFSGLLSVFSLSSKRRQAEETTTLCEWCGKLCILPWMLLPGARDCCHLQSCVAW